MAVNSNKHIKIFFKKFLTYHQNAKFVLYKMIYLNL